MRSRTLDFGPCEILLTSDGEGIVNIFYIYIYVCFVFRERGKEGGGNGGNGELIKCIYT